MEVDNKMIEVDIPGRGVHQFAHLALDYNGTLARDGTLIAGVEDILRTLSEQLRVHVLTADTFGRAAAHLERLPVELTVLSAGDQTEAKRSRVEELGSDGGVVAIGNGRNDRDMLAAATLGIAVILSEGAAVETVAAADVVCTSITDALGLLIDPLRLVATLRC